MQVQQIINRNQRVIPFLQHCLNILYQKNPELCKKEKVEEFITHFLKHDTEKLEEHVITAALKYFKT